MTKRVYFEPGDRVVLIIGMTAYPATLKRRNSEYRDDYWFLDFDDGMVSGHPFDEKQFLYLRGEQR